MGADIIGAARRRHITINDEVAGRDTRQGTVVSGGGRRGIYSTVTLFARFRGLSTSVPFTRATW